MLSSLLVSNIGITQVSSMEQQFKYESFMENARNGMGNIIFDYFLMTVGGVLYCFENDREEFDSPTFIDNLRFTMRGGHWVPTYGVHTLPFYADLYVSKISWQKMEPYVRIFCENLIHLSSEKKDDLRHLIEAAQERNCIGTGYQRKAEVDLDFSTDDDIEIDCDPFEGLDITGYSGTNAPEDSIKNDSETVCSICLQTLGYNESCIIHGKHAFHQSCLGEWWKAKVASPNHFQVCPVCKKNCKGSNLQRVKFVANKSSKK